MKIWEVSHFQNPDSLEKPKALSMLGPHSHLAAINRLQ
jgi:hypothetical protein